MAWVIRESEYIRRSAFDRFFTEIPNTSSWLNLRDPSGTGGRWVTPPGGWGARSRHPYSHVHVVDAQLAVEVFLHVTSEPHGLSGKEETVSAHERTDNTAPLFWPAYLARLDGLGGDGFEELDGLVVVQGAAGPDHVAEEIDGVQLPVRILGSGVIHKADLVKEKNFWNGTKQMRGSGFVGCSRRVMNNILCLRCCIRVWRVLCRTPAGWGGPNGGRSCPCPGTPSRWFQAGTLNKRWPPETPATGHTDRWCQFHHPRDEPFLILQPSTSSFVTLLPPSQLKLNRILQTNIGVINHLLTEQWELNSSRWDDMLESFLLACTDLTDACLSVMQRCIGLGSVTPLVPVN